MYFVFAFPKFETVAIFWHLLVCVFGCFGLVSALSGVLLFTLDSFRSHSHQQTKSVEPFRTTFFLMIEICLVSLCSVIVRLPLSLE